MILSHPNVQAHKLRFLEMIIPQLQEFSWFGTIGGYGDWWTARDALEVDAKKDNGEIVLALRAPIKIKGLTLDIPDEWRAARSLPNSVSLENGSLFFRELVNAIELHFVSIHK